MPVPSQPLPGYWPQLADWQIKAGEAPAPSHAATTFTSIRNRLPEAHAIRIQTLPMAPKVAPSERPVGGCHTLHVNDYTRNVLTTLVTPQDGCASRRYAHNADFRNALAIALALHPDGENVSLEAQLNALGLPSLLRDEPDYLPGSMTALSYDVGSRIVAIGRREVPELADLEAPGDLALLAAGAGELSYLDGRSRHAPQVAFDHKDILDFHYYAAGVAPREIAAGERHHEDSRPHGNSGLVSMEGDEGSADEGVVRQHAVANTGRIERAQSRWHDMDAAVTAPATDIIRPQIAERQIRDFSRHLERCRQQAEPPRARTRAKGRIPIRQLHEAPRARRETKPVTPPRYPLAVPHDPLYNCSIL